MQISPKQTVYFHPEIPSNSILTELSIHLFFFLLAGLIPLNTGLEFRLPLSHQL